MGPPGHNLCFPMKVWTPLGTPPRTPLAQEEWIFGSFGKLVLNFAATIFQGERRQERNWCCFLCRAGEAKLPPALLTLGTRNFAPRMDQRGSSGLNIDLSTFPAPSSSPCRPNLSMQTAPVWLMLPLSPIPHPSASELGVPPPPHPKTTHRRHCTAREKTKEMPRQFIYNHSIQKKGQLVPQLEQPPPSPSPAAFSHAPDFGSPSRGGSPSPAPGVGVSISWHKKRHGSLWT